MRLVGEGYVSAEDLDKTIRDGLGLRWSFMGPFETIELNAPGGIPDYCARFGATFAELASKPVTPELWGKDNIGRAVEQLGPLAVAAGHPRQAALARRAPRRPCRPQEKPAQSMSRRHPGLCRDPLRLSGQADRIPAQARDDRGDTHGQGPQSHHHLRRHGLDPHAVDVAAPADHGERDRGRRHRRGRGRRGGRAPARARSQGRPARSVAGGVRAVPQGDQAALQLRDQHHHRRRADHVDRGARARRRRPSSRRWRASTWAP